MLADNELWKYIREDMPYFDLTTHMLDFDEKISRLSIVTRDDIVVSCVEEAGRIAELLRCEVVFTKKSGEFAKKGEKLLEFQGNGSSLHEAWKCSQILLEYSCGMATYANDMVKKVEFVNPNCEILVTRKSFPFAKAFSIASLLHGGILPHRLGLSETVLIFSNHRKLFEDEKSFEEAIKKLKVKCVEKKLTIESECIDDAKQMLFLGADIIQMDKCSVEVLSELVKYKNKNYPNVKILAAGGINKNSVEKFVKTGVDAVVTSAPYQAKMADLTAIWDKQWSRV